MADATVQDDDLDGSGNAGETDLDVDGQPDAAAHEDPEEEKIREYLKQYTNEDGGIDVSKIVKENIHAQKELGRKGNEIGDLKKKAQDLDALLNHINTDPKRKAAWDKLISGDLDQGGTNAPVTSSDDLDKRLIEDMRAGKIAKSIETVVAEFMQRNGLFNEVQAVKRDLEMTKAEQAQRARNNAACHYLASLETEGWTEKRNGGHFFANPDLDARFVELHNQGYGPKEAFFIAKGELGIVETPKPVSAKKKAATVGEVGKTKTKSASDDGGDYWAGFKTSFEKAFGPDIAKKKA